MLMDFTISVESHTASSLTCMGPPSLSTAPAAASAMCFGLSLRSAGLLDIVPRCPCGDAAEAENVCAGRPRRGILLDKRFGNGSVLW